jgi:hypothetical protein
MSNFSILQVYIQLVEDLSILNKETESKVMSDDADGFIIKNINFFTKSFMITLCAYLESFLKDTTMTIIDDANKKLTESKIAYNLVKWSILKKDKLVDLNDNELKFEKLSIKIKKRELDDFISGNPYRTERLFKKIGINLSDDQSFREQKEKITTIVEKRNKIIHHNDSASDISFSDININVEIVKSYMKNIDLLVQKELSK